MLAKISDAGTHFWLYFIIFLIIVALVWWLVVRRWGSCKTRAVLGSKWVWMINIFNIFALAGYISGAPISHLIIAVLIFWVIAIIIAAVWQRGGCGWRGRWNKGSCEDSCDSNNNNDSCGSNNNWSKNRCNYSVNWRWALFALFWAIIGALFGLLLRHLQLTCLIAAFKVLAWTWWVTAILFVLLFGLLWTVAWRWAKCKPRCVALNKRTWTLLYFWIGLWLFALSGASWWVALILILVWRVITWALSYTWPYFCAPNHYAWGTIIAFFLGAIIGAYIIRYLQLADGAYLTRCAPIYPTMPNLLGRRFI